MLRKIFHLILITGFIFLFSGSAVAGELDPAFGVDGRVALEIGTYGDRAQAIVIQEDGKILLGGSSTNGESLAYSLIRLLPDGRPDPDFNGDGTVQLDLSSGDDEILALELLPDGDILAGGYAENDKDRDFVLVRFHSDGSLDTGFGEQGKVVTAVGNSDDEITALLVEDSGKILVAGNAAGTNGRVLVLGRYLQDGRLDSAFGDQGLSLTGVGTDALAQGMVADDNGRVVISGSYSDSETTRMMLAGFTADGLVDTGFGQNGVAVLAEGEEVSEGYGIFQAEDGTLYVAGSVGMEGERAAALFRFNGNGIADASFGEKGILLTEIGPEDDVLYSLAGNATSLNAAGFTTTNGNRDFLLITYDRQTIDQQKNSAQSIDFSHNKGATLHIGDLQVKKSLESFKPEPAAQDEQLLPAVVTTSFGTGESVSYGLAMQKDGKVVTVGTGGDNGTTSALVARFGKSKSLSGTSNSVDANVNITTLPLTEITATGAFSGGNINAALGAVTQRGVVFSIAPYPVCKDDCTTGGSGSGGDSGGGSGGGGGGGTDTTAPVITNTTSSLFGLKDNVILSITTDEAATCRFRDGSDIDFDSMTEELSGTGTTSHSRDIGAQSLGSHTFFIRCEDTAGNKNSSGTAITFTVGTSTSGLPENTLEKAGILLADASIKIGNFLVPSAHAQAVTGGVTAATTNTSTSSSLEMLKEGFTNDGSGTGLYSSILEDLAPDTRYYVRAYAIVGGVTYYGPQIAFETSSACFIATAAYGSLLHPAVAVLREFRDHFLNTNPLGRQFVTWYYINSPPIADRIATSTTLRFITRIFLVPLIGCGWLLLHPGWAGLLAFFLGILAIQTYRQQHVSHLLS